MSDRLGLEVLHDVNETVQQVPQFTFMVSCSYFLALLNFCAQVVVPVFVQ